MTTDVFVTHAELGVGRILDIDLRTSPPVLRIAWKNNTGSRHSMNELEFHMRDATVESIGQKIINRESLTPTEANIVFEDLMRLEESGVWIRVDENTGEGCRPPWVDDLTKEFHVLGTDPCVTMLAWKAVSVAYRKHLTSLGLLCKN